MNNLPPRLRTLTNSLDDLEVDAMLVTDETNVRYLSGFTGDSSYLLVHPSGTTILSDGRYETQIASECGSLASVIRPPGQLLSELTESVLNDLGQQRVGIESAQMSLASLPIACREMWCRGTGRDIRRGRNTADDQGRGRNFGHRQAVRIAERAFESLVPMLTAGWSERAIAHELEAKMRFLGAEGCSFPPIVAAGAAGALPHYHPGDAIIGDAATLLIDWGARYHGYASDLTRTLHRDNVSDRFRRAYEAVLEAQLAAIDAIGPGVAAKEVDAVARRRLGSGGDGGGIQARTGARHGAADPRIAPNVCP